MREAPELLQFAQESKIQSRDPVVSVHPPISKFINQHVASKGVHNEFSMKNSCYPFNLLVKATGGIQTTALVDKRTPRKEAALKPIAILPIGAPGWLSPQAACKNLKHAGRRPDRKSAQI